MASHTEADKGLRKGGKVKLKRVKGMDRERVKRRGESDKVRSEGVRDGLGKGKEIGIDRVKG